ncbi:MAG: hypothetical protein M1825_003069 [Sarcosagium campestre]|nr:MAG: hypothetical protein M1825_003069 [Sarcosagium campestre]
MVTVKKPAKRKKKASLLSYGRPPTTTRKATLSSKATRTVIRKHHQLNKELARARADGDTIKADGLATEMVRQGGLQGYQQASITGQSSERGGDSSKVLMQWMQSSSDSGGQYRPSKPSQRLRLLEVGALSRNNACARSGLFDLTRIDLNPQEEGILKQDFMERPLPISDEDKFDVLSLSLVLNFVPDAMARGNMLRHVCSFLRKDAENSEPGALFPCLFLVLPAPCITNSRYLDEQRLVAIMLSLSFVLITNKVSSKLFYSLWRHDPSLSSASTRFPKVEIRSGKSRNNFAIVIK